jgi:predicted transcriptional regulator
MPLVSVKLPQSTKERVAHLALSRDTTSHALMVQAIETAVLQAEQHDAFVNDALAAREEVERTGMVYDGAEYAAYLRNKARGLAAAKPAMRTLASYTHSQAA